MMAVTTDISVPLSASEVIGLRCSYFTREEIGGGTTRPYYLILASLWRVCCLQILQNFFKANLSLVLMTFLLVT